MDRAAFDRHEALLQLALAGRLGVGMPIAPNESAASLLAGLADGQLIYVLSHRSIWVSRPSSVAALSANTVINRSGGGRLLRTSYSDPAWRLGVTDVYINDVTGNAENEGIYVGAPGVPSPITGAEFARRWSNGELVRTGDAVNLTIRVHITGASLLECDVLTDADTFVRFLGENTTVVRSGNLAASGGFVVQNPNAAGGGTMNTITDAVGGAWSVGELVFFPATGATAYVLRDAGGGTAEISEPQTTDEPNFAQTPTTVVIANGAAWQVLTKVNVTWGRVSVQSVNRSAAAFTPQNNYADMNISTSAVTLPLQYQLYPNSFSVFYRCTFGSAVLMTPNVICNNCRAQNVADDWAGNGAPCGWYGGAICRPSGTGPIFVRLSQGLGDAGSLDYGTHIQSGYVYFHGLFTGGRFAVWDTIVEAIANPSGHAVIIGGGHSHRLLSGAHGGLRDRTGIPVFGNGAAGVGLFVAAGCGCTYETTARPNIFGTPANQIQLGSSAVGWAWSPTAGVYTPAAGLSLTWANMILAFGSGGFGDAAHEPNLNAHLTKSA